MYYGNMILGIILYIYIHVRYVICKHPIIKIIKQHDVNEPLNHVHTLENFN